MLGLAMLMWGAVLVSATPITYDNDLESMQDLVQAFKELVVSGRGVQEQLMATLQNVAASQEGLQRFLAGGSQLNLSGSDVTSVEGERPERDSNVAFFTRSVVAALNSGNNTQLDAILKEIKSLNFNFKKYFQSVACPEPFMNLGDECFSFQLEDKTWADSRQKCLEIGGDLAIPKNLTEVRLFINANFPRKNRRNFWLGGIENNKAWEWLSGDAVHPALWYTNEPSGNGDCLAMFDGWERPLSDFPCENERRSICEHVMRNRQH
ncbi:C-type lectin domain family 4 member M-like [Portunus trituberculatus]|uniref:C-type lectin domain family 4 member M-like n=1 Tax=Portunus trituberculatus TaxID=210409 RepID=UPI001E1CC265|nr:C-type lectin domain family 4 member M-like [Portunus trituberculatus]UPO70831.1 C-type lectin CTL-2 [Portunus trituberculatus]